MRNNTVRSWKEIDGHRVQRVDFIEYKVGDNKVGDHKSKRKLGVKAVILLFMSLILLSLSVTRGLATVDKKPYTNTKYYVNWDNYVFPNVKDLRSKVVKDYLEFKSMEVWEKIESKSKETLEELYKSAKKANVYCDRVTETKTRDNKIYYTGYTKKKLKNLRSSLVSMKYLYQYMDVALVNFDIQYEDYYKYQSENVHNVLRYLTSKSIKAMDKVSKEYDNEIPRDYFKVSYETVRMSLDEEIVAYNSLYTELVRGCVTLTYGEESNVNYNDTVVSMDTGKGYIIYPLGVAGCIKYVKVTYIVKED